MSVGILPLAVEGLVYAPSGTALIDRVGFALEAGPRTVILGPNGAGKSLLLRLCHGLLSPTAGRIAWRLDDPRRQAMVFQKPVTLRRSVAANVAYGLSLRGIEGPDRDTRVAEALDLAGLGPLAARPARVLSGGEQQRLALARAWALHPEVLFLDEPTANLDPAATKAVEEMVNAFDIGGTKIVMTTHDLGQARRMADEILFMHRGRLIERSAASEFFAGPKAREAAAFLRGELAW